MLIFECLKKKLYLPETSGLTLDAPALTAKRRAVIQKQRFLRRIYIEWYILLTAAVPAGPGKVLEIGSGGGFMKEFIPNLLTSDIFPIQGVDMVMDACREWPFQQHPLKAVLMVDVLHHLPNVYIFFREAEKAIRADGIIAMIEPWVTPWSRLFYSYFHHEPFMPHTLSWHFRSNGPLSGANSALPWIIFNRDRTNFEKDFSKFNIETILPFMPFSYILSGGLTFRSFATERLYSFVRCAEKWTGLEHKFAMFAYIILRRKKFRQ